jgi:hypothetical protein
LATLLIKIQTKDLASSHPCMVKLHFNHNHPINSFHSLSFRSISNSTKLLYNKLFEKNYNAATAHRYYEFQLELTTNEDDLQLILANRAINPDRCAA